MRIAFSGIGHGFGNNGGTRTTFLSAIELASQGHSVEIWSDGPNRLTWFQLPASVPYLVSPSGRKVDVLIATGAGSVPFVVSYTRKKRGAYWIRGIETWAQPEDKLIAGYKSGLDLYVNSIWMKDWIAKRVGVTPTVVYPGVEIGHYVPPETRSVSSVVIGALYSAKSSKRVKDVTFLFQRLVKERENVVLWLMGTEKNPKLSSCSRYFRNPTEQEKAHMYQGVHVWVAPTNTEGLHVPPLEAGACGCALVAHGMPSAGMGDYAIHEQTALVYAPNDLEQAYMHLKRLVDSAEDRQRLGTALRAWIVEKIGNRHDNMQKFAALLGARL